MSTKTISIEHEGKTYGGQLATIKSTMVGIAFHHSANGYFVTAHTQVTPAFSMATASNPKVYKSKKWAIKHAHFLLEAMASAE